MFRLRSKSGDESVFRTPEEIRAALLSGFITPDAQIWDAELKGWVPLLEHSLYQQIAATPGGRKSNAVKAPPAGSSPASAKPVQKLVIRRPGEPAAPAAPAAPTPPPTAPKPPAPKPPVVEETPDLVMLDVDLSMDTEPEPTPAPAPPSAPKAAPAPPPAPAAPAAPPKRPTPLPAPSTPAPEPRRSIPAARQSAPAVEEDAGEAAAEGGSKKGLIIAAVLVLAAAGGGLAFLRGKGAEPPAQIDSLALAAAVAAIDSAPDSTAATTDTTKVDSTTVAATPVDTAVPAPVAAPAAVDSAPAAVAAVPGVPFAPSLERGFTSWNVRAPTGQPLSIAELETVRLRYIAAQDRALEQFEAGLEAIGFSDMFNPSRIGRQDRRDESVEAVDAAHEALQDFRRRVVALDFAYTDSLRQALPAGADTPDLRTFGPLRRESAAQLATTDSLLTSVSGMYTLLVNSPGGFTLRGRDLVFKDAAKADQYRVLQEQLTAQLGRLRTRPGSEIPPAMAAILRGIGVPR